MVESVEVIIKQPGQADRVVRLQEGATRLGRAEDNEVVLSDVGVSRRHAQVYVSRGEVTVEDLGSGNGTYYNGYRIQSQPISDGDEVVVDPFVLQFRIRGQQAGKRLDQDEIAPARLEVVVGTGLAGSSYPINSRGLSIGRAEDRDVVIADPAASRHHAQISLQTGEYVLRDMGSANGIFVNAVRVRECTLADGDLIRIGNTEMRFVRYHEGAGDNTTQVVQGGAAEQWQSSWEEPPPARSGRGGLILGLVITLLLLLGAATVVFLIIVLVLVVLLWQPATLEATPAQPPRWELALPNGLAGATFADLARTGTEKMAQGQRKEALQDFYRVLREDPNYLSYLDNFAFATGEGLVLEAMRPGVDAAQVARRQREAKRDKLLAESRGANSRAAKDARSELEASFREDPVVMKAFGWKPTQAMIAAKKKADEGQALIASDPGGAIGALIEVLATTPDPELRRRAETQLAEARRAVSRASAAETLAAVDAQVLADSDAERAAARQAFAALALEHAAHPSARIRGGM